MKLIKLKNKYTNNKLIYLEKETYKVVKKIIKDVYKIFKEKILIVIGYQTPFCTKDYYNNGGQEKMYQDYESGCAFKLLINDEKIKIYIKEHLDYYGLILRDNEHLRFVGRDAFLINKFHLNLEDFIKMFK